MARLLRHAAPAVLMFLAVTLLGCRPGSPVVDPSSDPAVVTGTVSGTVRGPDGAAPAANRMVVAVNLATGERFETKTGSSGGYTLQLPPGDYRLELTLEPGESLASSPGEIHLNRSDLDPGRDFVLAGAGTATPR